MTINNLRDRISDFRRLPGRELQDNTGNWREHPQSQRQALTAVLKDIGIADALIAYESDRQGGLTLIDGHLRTEDHPDANWPTLILDVDDAEADALLAALDPLAAMAQANLVKLAQLKENLAVNSEELKAALEQITTAAGLLPQPPVLPDPPEPQLDKAEQLRDKWQTASGQLWQLGEHRLICGDCTDRAVVERVMGGQKINGCFTSPPYAEQRKKQYGGIPTGQYIEWCQAVQENVREFLAEDGSFFVNIKEHCEEGQRVLYCKKLVIAMVEQWGWRWVDELCWEKPGQPGIFGDRFRNDFELVYHFSIDRCKFIPSNVLHKTNHLPIGSKGTNSKMQGIFGNNLYSRDKGEARPGNVIKISFDNSGLLGHPGKFPIPLPTFFIRAYSDPGDIWLDPFLGSGTTLIACENEGRIGYGIELLEKYVAVVLQRWVDWTGQQPQLIVDNG